MDAASPFGSRKRPPETVQLVVALETGSGEEERRKLSTTDIPCVEAARENLRLPNTLNVVVGWNIILAAAALKVPALFGVLPFLPSSVLADHLKCGLL